MKPLSEFLRPEFLRRHRWPALAAVGVLALVAFWLFGGSSKTTGTFRTEDVVRGDLVITVSATGKVQPTNQVDVGSELSGTVAAVLVDENDKVRKGEVLARLDASKLQNAVTRAQAALHSAAAGVAQAEATTIESRADLARLRKVQELSGGKVPSANDIEAAEAAVARSVATVDAARAGVAEARASLQSVSTDLARSSIRSPINGIVLTRKVEPGQTVAASLQAPVLFTLAEDLARMELQVNVDEADVGRVQAGQQATFTVDAWPNRDYPAKLMRVSYGAQTTDGVVSYEATLAVDNKDLSLRPGMTATAVIGASRRDHVLLVPNAALRFAPPDATAATKKGNSFVSSLMPRLPQQRPKTVGNHRKGNQQQVYVLVNGMPQAVPVTVGDSDGKMTEVTGGDLREGSAVIVEYSGTAP